MKQVEYCIVGFCIKIYFKHRIISFFQYIELYNLFEHNILICCYFLCTLEIEENYKSNEKFVCRERSTVATNLSIKEKINITSINEDSKQFKQVEPITDDMNIMHEGVSRLVMLDRYAFKDTEKKTLKKGEFV